MFVCSTFILFSALTNWNMEKIGHIRRKLKSFSSKSIDINPMSMKRKISFDFDFLLSVSQPFHSEQSTRWLRRRVRFFMGSNTLRTDRGGEKTEFYEKSERKCQEIMIFNGRNWNNLKVCCFLFLSQKSKQREDYHTKQQKSIKKYTKNNSNPRFSCW